MQPAIILCYFAASPGLLFGCENEQQWWRKRKNKTNTIVFEIYWLQVETDKQYYKTFFIFTEMFRVLEPLSEQVAWKSLLAQA